jgi:hypothetical protein
MGLQVTGPHLVENTHCPARVLLPPGPGLGVASDRQPPVGGHCWLHADHAHLRPQLPDIVEPAHARVPFFAHRLALTSSPLDEFGGHAWKKPLAPRWPCSGGRSWREAPRPPPPRVGMALRRRETVPLAGDRRVAGWRPDGEEEEPSIEFYFYSGWEKKRGVKCSTGHQTCCTPSLQKKMSDSLHRHVQVVIFYRKTLIQLERFNQSFQSGFQTEFFLSRSSARQRRAPSPSRCLGAEVGK